MSLDNNPLITQICLQDVDELVENFCFPWDTLEKTEAKWKRYFEEYQTEIRTIAVAKSRNKIVGYGSLLYTSEYPLFADVPEINDVWIHEKHRGVGLGTALIQWFEALAKDKAIKRLVLELDFMLITVQLKNSMLNLDMFLMGMASHINAKKPRLELHIH